VSVVPPGNNLVVFINDTGQTANTKNRRYVEEGGYIIGTWFLVTENESSTPFHSDLLITISEFTIFAIKRITTEDQTGFQFPVF
jgi:hypothetical protein